METAPQTMPPSERRAATKTSSAWLLGKAAFAVALMICGVVGIARLETGLNFWPFHHPIDDIPQPERQLRADAFAAMGALQLQAIPGQDVATAVEAMGLPPAQRQALQSAVIQSAPVPQESSAMQPVSSRSVSAKSRLELSKAAAGQRLKLAWLTLWDTDVEDGDVVRIESQGYSRTVTLTKAPLTFAIPVPANGVVRVVGIKDGDGGGITVGLASGASKAVFPIMSVSQVLNLRVQVN